MSTFGKIFVFFMLLEVCETAVQNSCSVRSLLMPRVTGGVPANLGEIPWQARLDGKGGLCGGVIVGSNWILTAAHCLRYGSPSARKQVNVGEVIVNVGVIYTNDPDGEVEVEALIPHPQYNETRFDYDFALIKLAAPLEWTNNVQPACLPRSCAEEARVSTSCLISGYGKKVYEDMAPSSQLQKAMVPLVSNVTCQRAFDNVPEIEGFKLTERMLCAGYPQGNVDTCQGDSGGPLVCRDRQTGSYMLNGVASFGYQCGRSGLYGIYSRVCTIIGWIDDVVNSRYVAPILAATTTPATRISSSRTTRSTTRRRSARATTPPITTTAAPSDQQLNCRKPSSMNIPATPSRISGSEMPWLVRLNTAPPNGRPNVTCGGTVLSRQWILTSARCAVDRNTKITVYATTGQNLQNPVVRVIPHPEFDPTIFDNDFTLIKLAKPINFGNTIASLCLPAQCSPREASTMSHHSCIAAGWQSQIPPFGGNTKPAQKVAVAVTTPDECRSKINSDLYRDGSMCVQDPVEKTARCQTDLGGPLVCKQTDSDQGSYSLTAITSRFTFGCDAGFSSVIVYSRACLVTEWILDTMSMNSESIDDNVAISNNFQGIRAAE